MVLKNNIIMIKRLRSLFKHDKIRYLFIGGTSVVIEYCIFILLNDIFVVNVIFANAISFLAGFFYTFIFHKSWTFKGEYYFGLKKQFSSYATLAIVNIIITSFLIELQVSVLHIPAFIAKLVCMLLIVSWNYLLLNRIIFKKIAK